MKDYTMTFYDNTDPWDKNDKVRQYLFENFNDEDWETPDDIPAYRIDQEIDLDNDCDWYNFKAMMEKMLSEEHCLLTGVCGRWDGPARGGKFIETFRDFASCIEHLDYLRIYEKNGHLYVDGYHHDGSDHYELKKLTRKGYEYAERNYFAHDGFLHSTLMNFNFYSALPRLSRYA